jgi:hypothetical protein
MAVNSQEMGDYRKEMTVNFQKTSKQRGFMGKNPGKMPENG